MNSFGLAEPPWSAAVFIVAICTAAICGSQQRPDVVARLDTGDKGDFAIGCMAADPYLVVSSLGRLAFGC